MAVPDRATRIIVADDDDLVRAVLRMALSGPAVELAEAADSEALVAAAANGPVDLAILDISIPGPGLAPNIDTVRSAHPAAKILILSGDYEVPASEAERIDDFAHKPIELADLRDRVRRLLGAPAPNGAS